VRKRLLLGTSELSKKDDTVGLSRILISFYQKRDWSLMLLGKIKKKSNKNLEEEERARVGSHSSKESNSWAWISIADD